MSVSFEKYVKKLNFTLYLWNAVVFIYTFSLEIKGSEN